MCQRERGYAHRAGPAILRLKEIAFTSMLLFLCEDEHGWLYEPHGTEPDVWTLTAPGGEILRSSGWKPYEMPRVSRHVHESLLIDGLLAHGRSDPPGCEPAASASRGSAGR